MKTAALIYISKPPLSYIDISFGRGLLAAK
jgi:hypothetical protein